MNSFFKIACLTLCFYLLAGCGAPLSQSVPQNKQAPIGDGLEVDARKSFADIPIAGSDSIDISRSLLLNSGEQWIGQAVILFNHRNQSRLHLIITLMKCQPSAGR